MSYQNVEAINGALELHAVLLVGLSPFRRIRLQALERPQNVVHLVRWLVGRSVGGTVSLRR